MSRNRRPRSLAGLLLAACVLVVGCGDQEAADQPPGLDAGDPEATEPAPGEDEGETGAEEDFMPLDGDPEELVIRDAADRAGVELGEVQVVSNEPVTWSDGSLGCPEEGQFYTQALVEGYRIVVEAGGESMEYHGQAGQAPFYCEDPQEPVQDEGTVEE
ncbi:hypothetical protein [Egicoccus sp. AB-alg2]|uniref:hypothetical protein n=1 Tax=Egicoccus sp. AB-alg2 TaxID=3242693 RepID=UPI00359ECA8F